MTKNNPGNIKSEHLSSDDLLRYNRRLLSENENSLIEKHLNECELCSDAMKGVEEMHDALRIFQITHELRNRMKKRVSVRKKIFSGMDLLSIVMILFVLGLLLIITFYFLYIKL